MTADPGDIGTAGRTPDVSALLERQLESLEDLTALEERLKIVAADMGDGARALRKARQVLGAAAAIDRGPAAEEREKAIALLTTMAKPHIVKMHIGSQLEFDAAGQALADAITALRQRRHHDIPLPLEPAT